jgi:hypothetical protein
MAAAAAGSHPTPTKHPSAREERERARKSVAEHPQQASAEIDKARQEATADVRRSLDSALERMRDVSGELRQRAKGQAGAASAERRRCQELTDGRPRVAPGRPPSGCVECRIQSAAGGPSPCCRKSVRPVGRVKARWPRSTSWS